MFNWVKGLFRKDKSPDLHHSKEGNNCARTIKGRLHSVKKANQENQPMDPGAPLALSERLAKATTAAPTVSQHDSHGPDAEGVSQRLQIIQEDAELSRRLSEEREEVEAFFNDELPPLELPEFIRRKNGEDV